MATISLTVQPNALLLQSTRGEKSVPFSGDQELTVIGQRLNQELTDMGATELKLATPSASRFSATVVDLAGRRVVDFADFDAVHVISDSRIRLPRT